MDMSHRRYFLTEVLVLGEPFNFSEGQKINFYGFADLLGVFSKPNLRDGEIVVDRLCHTSARLISRF